jgi:hypothetical protein
MRAARAGFLLVPALLATLLDGCCGGCLDQLDITIPITATGPVVLEICYEDYCSAPIVLESDASAVQAFPDGTGPATLVTRTDGGRTIFIEVLVNTKLFAEDGQRAYVRLEDMDGTLLLLRTVAIEYAEVGDALCCFSHFAEITLDGG